MRRRSEHLLDAQLLVALDLDQALGRIDKRVPSNA